MKDAVSPGPHRLSNALRELRRILGRYSPRQLTGEDMEAVLGCLDVLATDAREIEAECNRLRVSEFIFGLRCKIDINAVQQEISRPDTNVALFPVIPRPAPTGVQPTGAQQ